MPKRQIYYSFHYEKDVMRVQQIRNMGVLEGNTPVCPNDWENLKKEGDTAVRKWIDNNMHYRSCVIVLIGEETASRKWVLYEIEKAWKDGKGILGIYIHHLKCPREGVCKKGDNPFDHFLLSNGLLLSTVVKTYDPKPEAAYQDIKTHISEWIELAIEMRKTSGKTSTMYTRSALKLS